MKKVLVIFGTRPEAIKLMLCTIQCEMIFIIRRQNGQKAAD